MRNRKTIKYLCHAAIIAALYVVLTLLSAAFGLSGGVIQCRLSEALCVLPCFTPAAIPGLTVGCLLANILTASSVWDIVFGPLATLIGALGAYLLRRLPWAVPAPTVLANTLIIPLVLKYAYGMGDAWWFLAVTVGLGELISAGLLGGLLLYELKKLNAKKGGLNL